MLFLVSGANGFVGSGVCRLLAERGCRVRALLHRDAAGPWHEQILCDLASGSLSSSACEGVDGIFHVAGLAHVTGEYSDTRSAYWRVNVDGTRLLLESAIAAGVERFVYFSSVKAAGDPGEDCVDESWGAPPGDAYGQSKRAAEEIVLSASSLDRHVSVLRPTLVYGCGVKGNLQRMIGAVAAGRFPPLPEFYNRRSMVSVSDLAEAAWLAMSKNVANGRIYIVADGVDYSTRMLYRSIQGALGRQPPRWSLPLWLLVCGARVGDLITGLSGRPMPISSAALERLRGSACYRASRLRRELGWVPGDDFYGLAGAMVSASVQDGYWESRQKGYRKPSC